VGGSKPEQSKKSAEQLMLQSFMPARHMSQPSLGPPTHSTAQLSAEHATLAE
jgi:hypothetical protein